MPAEPDLQPQKFRATRWSLVLQSRGEGPEAKRALEDLCRAYWFPLYAWCRRYGLSPTDAEDMVQGFFVQVLEKRLFDFADAERGKLRTFLLTVLQRHVNDERGKARAQRRGGGKVISFDSIEAEEWYSSESIAGESADQLYDRQWALTVLDNAVRRLEEEAIAKNKGEAFMAMRPFLTGESDAAEYDQAAGRVAMKPATFRVAVHRLRTKFREALRTEVAETQPDGANIDEEIGYLMEVLRGI